MSLSVVKVYYIDLRSREYGTVRPQYFGRLGLVNLESCVDLTLIYTVATVHSNQYQYTVISTISLKSAERLRINHYQLELRPYLSFIVCLERSLVRACE